jgi:hypothetical protein
MTTNLETIKFSVVDSENTNGLYEYVANILCKDESLPTTVTQTDRYVLLESTPEILKTVIDRFMEDYCTLGFEIEQEFDLFDVIVYCSNPELQAFYTGMRLNIHEAETAALVDCINDINATVEKLASLSGYMDVQNTLNGTYKLRHVINAIVHALEQKGIFLDLENLDELYENVH